MSIVIACSCGHRFEVIDRAAGRQIPCPACAQELDIPSQPVFSLSSQKFLGPGAGARYGEAPPEGEAFAKLPLCNSCQGAGVCQGCKGKRNQTDLTGIASRSLFRGIMVVLFGWMGLFADQSVLMGSSSPASSGRCHECNGNGKCFKCRGLGRLVE